MASLGSVFSSNDLRNLRLNLFVRKYGKNVVHFILTFHFLHGQNKSIREILIDNQVPLQGRCPFNPQEIKNITEKSPEDLDITVMNKICQVLWQKGVNDPGDTLKGLLKKIKDKRNFVSHEEPRMSDTDLEIKLRDFQSTLEETLEKTKSLFPKHSAAIDDLKTEIQEAVPKLLEKIREKYDPSSPQDVQKLKEEIEEFGTELSDMILKSTEAELLSLHERLFQILPYDWLAQYGTTDPDNIMVSLQVADDPDLNRGPQGNKSIIVNQTEILNKDKIGKDPEVVIISGDAGSGKTTILCSFAEGWCKKANDIPELSSFPFIISMMFRSDEHDNFHDYFKSLVPKTAALFPFDQVKSVVLGSKCLVLCDGYDEANEKSKKLFNEFLELNSKNMKFVVTTRPSNIEGLTNIVNKVRRSRINLKISGLQKEDMKLLTEKLIGYLVKDNDIQQEQMKKELLQKIEEMNTGTRAILQTPLYFNLYILLYIECPYLRDELNTRTSLYLELRKHKIKRISNKTGMSVESLEEFDAIYRKWSLKHYIERKYEWSQADIESFKREIICPEVLQNFDFIMSSYFSLKKTQKNLEIVKVYCHRHRSEQEFAVAGNICDDVITSSRRLQRGNIIQDLLRFIRLCDRRLLRGNIILDVMRSKELWDGRDLFQFFRKFRVVISFILGILYSNQRDVYYNIINEIHELYVSYSLSQGAQDVLCEPCIETRLDFKVLESLVSEMKKTSLKDRVTFREPKSLYVLPPLLPKLRPKKINLEFLRTLLSDVSQINKTLEAAVVHNIRTEIWISKLLSDYSQHSGQEVLHPVDKLGLVIWDVDEYQDLESLRPINLMTPAKELKLIYRMSKAPEERYALAINRTIPTNREEGTTDLWIDLHKDRDIKLLLQLLTVSSLRSICIYAKLGTKIDDVEYVEELKALCRKKRLGVLCSNLWANIEERK
ncbi:uncharacterized protein LOC135198202 [Macrobrachium nipponense]|uniref:uncharacterized protein LOC135198202 n=1 Tax=Macrobrachium nipponense TaxID=159736 RepID=UPI0030C8A231